MLIVFEGPDGSGKTALVEAVKKVYDKKGIVSVVTKEPGSPHVEACKRIRGIVLDSEVPVSDYGSFLLFMVDRMEHFKSFIQPHQSDIILCDRNYLSTEVYQIHMGMGNKIPEEFAKIHQALAEVPDGYVFVDTPLEVCLSRIQGKSSKVRQDKESRFDDKDTETHTRVHKIYKQLYKEDFGTRKLVVDGTLPLSVLSEKVIEFVNTITKVRAR